jgi:hypothetical protein
MSVKSSSDMKRMIGNSRTGQRRALLKIYMVQNDRDEEEGRSRNEDEEAVEREGQI